MVPVMSRILCWRKNKLDASLSNIKPQQLFQFDRGKIAMKALPVGTPSLDEFIHKKCKLPFVDAADLSEFISIFSLKSNYRKFTRGKFVLWFVVEFCKSIHSSSPDIFTAITKKPKALCELSDSNGVAILGPRVTPPSTLMNFLRTNYVEYIKWHESRYAMN